MPGYTIHIAIANKYIEKHNENDKESFIKGVIDPDLLAEENKNKTHYSLKGSPNTNLMEFLKQNKIENSYQKGYFLHLITDYLFYNKYFKNYNKDIYNDYDILNKELIEKYHIEIPKEIEGVVKFKEGKLKVLERKKLVKMIDEISKKDLKEYEKDILDGKFSN